MDTQKGLMTYLYDKLTGDDDLETAMGGSVRLYPVWATPDAPLPYLVHRIDQSATDKWMLRQCTYYLDIWDYSPNAERTLLIRKRIIELLDQLLFEIDEAYACRLWLQTDGFIPETTQNIWHYALQFNLRHYRQSEVVSIVNR